MMKRFLISLIISLAMVAAVPAVFNVYAEDSTPQEGDVAATVLEETYRSSTPLDNDELFEYYVEAQLGVISAPAGSGSRGSRLTGLNKTIYNLLRPELRKIADGERSSTEIGFTVSELGLSDSAWTAGDLGVDTLVEDGMITEKATDALSEKLDLRVGSIVNALVADCPYDLYWFNKVGGVSYNGLGVTAAYNGTEWVMTMSEGITFYFSVAQNYSDGDYTVNTGNVERVQNAVSKAAAIVEKDKGKSDYEKLVDYREQICSLVSYDTAAAAAETSAYGDSWQLISVFDEDPDTNVVCEGYSKAFQYLCDLTDFKGDISCISVTGHMSGGTGAGAHMWNIVNMEDKRNYIVDVTNCDKGNVGYPDMLFLAGYSAKNGNTEFEFYCDGYTVIYTYDDVTMETFATDELTVSADSYSQQDSDLWTSHEAEPSVGDKETESEPYDISGAAVSNIRAKVYNGKDLTQKPVVKIGDKTLKEGEDYSLTYKNNRKVGLAAVTITGKGAYTDSISVNFKINPQATKLKSVKPARKGFTAKWAKKTTQITGYQLQYSTSKKFRSGSGTRKLTAKKAKTVSKKITRLKAKKKYYVRIRTYRTVNGKKYFSAWSKYKIVKTKK